jgi:hypothetical protein
MNDCLDLSAAFKVQFYCSGKIIIVLIAPRLHQQYPEFPW